MSHQLPNLPYSVDSLEPHIDARTMEIHHGKHHAGYTSKLNAAVEGTDIEDIKKKTETLVQASMKLGEAIYKSQQSKKPDSEKDAGKDEKEKKDDNVVDADFEEVKDENKEKSA